MQKYLFIIDTIKQGGAENILLRFSEYLKNQGTTFEIFVLFGKESSNIIPGELKINSNSFFYKFIQQLILKHRFKKIKKKFRPDIVFSFLERSNIIALDSSHKNCKVIISVHNNIGEQYKKYGTIKQKIIKHIINKKYNRKSYKIIAVSQIIKEDLIQNFGIIEEKIVVINNSVDRNKVHSLSEAEFDLNINKNAHTLITIGRAEYQKAQWKLLKAIYYLKKNSRIENIELIMLGDGEYLSQLKKLAKNLCIENSIHFKGFVKNPFPYLKNSDLLVLPSIYEGFPVSVSEAAVLKTGFVGSQNAIPKEIYQSISQWESYTYQNINTDPDFTNNVLEDDITLAELILTGINNKDRIVQAASAWAAKNSEKSNFESYWAL